jgi:hypothetical protein
MQSDHNSSATSQAINEALRRYSDKDWSYSRITVQLRPLSQMQSPYVLWIDRIDTSQKAGKTELARLSREVSWGCRHGDELGILELVSLRINKALIESTSEDYWNFKRPIVRIVKRQELEMKGVAEAFWYEVVEVGGEDFDNR